MKFKVTYSGQARSTAGCANEVVELPAAATLRELLAAIAARHGERMAALLNFKERNTPAVLVFVSDEQVTWEAPPPLNDGAEIMLVSPISGG
ncbi:MAG: hypothetical protein JWN40_4413 [Phycisphaerales bacterium]|nr:hypothetical protein [Phycisphaerales bacterium]